MADLVGILDLYDRLVAAALDVAPSDEVERAAAAGRAARRRLGYLGESVVVALVGGTGSGKSSLLNALAGEEVSEPGARRPTTARPIAWIPSNPEPGLTRLLDDLEIERRVGQDRHPWLAVLDLPDTDSVVVDHRLAVERLLPLVDAVIWVLDPEKYQDARLHRDFIRPLAAHSERFVFALNQIDRVDPKARPALVEDLRQSLVSDGIGRPRIVVTAGDPEFGAPCGIESLVDAVADLGSASTVVRRRIVEELAAGAERLVGATGGTAASGFVSRWTAARNEVAEEIAAAVDVGLRRAASATARADARAVTSWVGSRALADRVTGVTGAVSERAAAPLLDLVDAVASSLDIPSRRALAEVAEGIPDEVVGAGRSVGAVTSVRLGEPPAWWSSVRLLSYGAAAAALVALVAIVDGFRSDAAMTIRVALFVLAVAAMTGIRRAVRRSAESRVQHALADRRDETAMAVSAELERRVGRPLRTVLRRRSAPAAAYTELMLAMEEEK